MIFALQLIPLTLLGALLGLDAVSFPQAMISRPIVAATLGGALVGDAGKGLLIGVILELFALETLPFGASRYPEWGSASVVGGALFAMQPHVSAGALAVSTFAALSTAFVGGWSMVQHRKLIAHWAGRLREQIAGGSADAVMTLQLRGLTSDIVRAGLMTFLALMVFVPLARVLLAAGTFDAWQSRVVVVAAAGAVGAGAIWKVVHTTKGAPWYFLGGLIAGGTLLLVT
jgi:mannose/fructose/N-acetylgalactosamine-specific phosphotransferase system component IIC